MKISTPAKINLYLKITGKRPDGYHEIDTLFLPLPSLSDEISVAELDLGARKEKLLITSSAADIPLNEDNICFRAAVEFAKSADIKPSWKIHIEKNIPVAAGLGGGSSDAAALLLILKQLYPGINEDAIMNIARSLGADVPFFLDPCPAVARGIGDIITPLPGIPEVPVVIVNPLFPVSAAWAYKNYCADTCTSSPADVIRVLKSGNFYNLDRVFCNDLQKAVFDKFPIMGILKTALLEAGAEFAGMSGSGPTLFAVCSSRDKAGNISEKIKSRYGDAVYSVAASTSD